MIVDYELFPYLAMISALIASGIAVWRGLSAAKTLAALVLAVYLPALFVIEFLPFSFVKTELLSQDMGAYPCPFSLIGELLSASDSGFFASCSELLKMSLTFVPLGLLIPALFSSRRKKRILCVLAITSIGIELVQLIENAAMGTFSKRISFDEALLAFLGGVLGYLIWNLVVSLREMRQNCLIRR